MAAIRSRGIAVRGALFKDLVAFEKKHFDMVRCDYCSVLYALLTIIKFLQCFFDKLPFIIAVEIFQYLAIADFAPLPSVCSYWNTIGKSNELWQVCIR